ncbi:hypothetical protein [Streptomyces sp. 049-1]|uniref:hypothetical protein n=1 Tax=Streptomyces sp. 049-1 TaxID=2789264 RepID=UPI00397F8B0E
MTRKARLSPQAHTELGHALAAIRDELGRRATQLHNAYPRTGHEATPARKLTSAVRAIDNARNNLDNALFREHPRTATTTAYYPNAEDRALTLRLRGSGPASEADVSECPACAAPSYYARELDRYVHADGRGNAACWLAISRGETS